MAQSAQTPSQEVRGLRPYLSPLGAWALAFGCSVGWGSFVMPGSTFLPLAGPWGTAIGMLVGGLVMLLIGTNYYYMMKKYPDCGGTFAFVKQELGYDHGFLSAWFLSLVYLAIVWANATAIPLICRNLFGNLLSIGPHYQVAGFDVYLAEALVSAGAILFSGLVCLAGGRLSSVIQSIFAIILIGGVTICAASIFLGNGVSITEIQPRFASDGSHALQIFRIVALAPWAYAGFESISHSSEEFHFPVKRAIAIMISAVVTAALAYSLLALIAVSALPKGAADWKDYILHLSEYSGVQSLPTFHSVFTYMGKAGFLLLGLTTAGGILTGLIGNTIASSRLLYAAARDDMLPKKFAQLRRNGVPRTAILFVMLISLPVPFLGRTAISWIVDVNTIGATIAYLYTSVVAYKAARRDGNRIVMYTGILGAFISGIFTLYFLIPNFWSVEALTAESYLILIGWGILGFLFFYSVFQNDKRHRFGKSTVVWIVLLFLLFFLSMLWFRESSNTKSAEVLKELSAYHENELEEHGYKPDATEKKDTDYYLDKMVAKFNHEMQQNSLIQMAIIFLALFIMFKIYSSMYQRAQMLAVEKAAAEESNRAKSAFLSNMSHDIRTPMNAIIGYTEITKEIEGLPEDAAEYLGKIEASSRHLLALINDVLDMSRIESGKMELDLQRANLAQTVGEIKDLFATQMEMKGIEYTVDTDDVSDPYVLCDANRLNRVLLNLVSNAFKFTPADGSVRVVLTQEGSSTAPELENGTSPEVLGGQDTESAHEGQGTEPAQGGQTAAPARIGHYVIRVKDSGMGMSPEFAARVFEAYEREKTVSKIQGTGLGMAITKSIVDLMGGKITVETEQGKGTEFILHLDFAITKAPAKKKPQASSTSPSDSPDSKPAELDFSQFKLLLVEDQVVNREIATMILKKSGFQVETAENGKIAVEKVQASQPGDFAAVLMDIQMPVMDGYASSQAIRALEDPQLAKIPIIAMTANAFAEDVQKAKAAGMDAHIAKPIEIGKMIETLTEILST